MEDENQFLSCITLWLWRYYCYTYVLFTQTSMCKCSLVSQRVLPSLTEERHSLDYRWRGDSAFSPEASITIHYYSALSVCKCFLTTRDSQPACFPRPPSAEADEPSWTVNARPGKMVRQRNMRFLT